MTNTVRTLALAAIGMGAVMPVAAGAAQIEIAVKNPVIELTLTEIVQSPPDTANVGAGVTVRAPTASEALRRNAEQMDKVIARLRQLGIAREDIQTANFSLNAQYQYRNDSQPPVLLGYDASNSVNVTLRKLDKVGETLDALVSAGANNLYGPNFTLERMPPPRLPRARPLLPTPRCRRMNMRRWLAIAASASSRSRKSTSRWDRCPSRPRRSRSRRNAAARQPRSSRAGSAPGST